MSVFDLLLPWAIVLGLLIPVRRLERWLHQHIFKVGWLVTKSLHTTTILYYTAFLPGVVLHEFLVWLVAGMLNVRADRSIKMPEKQEMAELKLNFIKIDHKKAGAFRVAVIYLAPLVGGIFAIWLITNNVLNLSGFLALLSTGDLDDVGGAISQLFATPDFWLWVYIAFSISATMTPDTQYLRGWRLIVPPIIGVFVVLFAIGVGNKLLLDALESLAQGAGFLIGTFAAVIFVNLLMTGLLGAIEAIIERITGDSATFQNGKMVAMRREEVLKLRQEQAEKARRAAEKPAPQRKAVAAPPSIYKLPLPIPGLPDKESLEPITVTKPPTPTLPVADTPKPLAAPVINKPTLETKETAEVDEKASSAAGSPLRASSPFGTPAKAPIKPDDEDDEDEKKVTPAAASPIRASAPFGVPAKAPIKPDDDDKADENGSAAAASPLRSSSPFGTPAKAPIKPNDDDDELPDLDELDDSEDDEFDESLDDLAPLDDE